MDSYEEQLVRSYQARQHHVQPASLFFSSPLLTRKKNEVFLRLLIQQQESHFKHQIHHQVKEATIHPAIIVFCLASCNTGNAVGGIIRIYPQHGIINREKNLSETEFELIRLNLYLQNSKLNALV